MRINKKLQKIMPSTHLLGKISSLFFVLSCSLKQTTLEDLKEHSNDIHNVLSILHIITDKHVIKNSKY